MLAPRSWLHLPRRTVRLRLTALYGGLFLVSGAVLLAITYGLVAGRSEATAFRIVGTQNGVVKAVEGPAPEALKVCKALGVPCPRGSVSNVVHVPPGASFGFKGPVSALPLGGTAQIEATLPTPSQRKALLIVSAIALGIMAVISIGLGWLMAGRALLPLRTMTATARQISEENLHERLAVHGPNDELKDLGDTIDGLLARLETAFEAQRRFVANASHELRTPLAMMRTSVEVALGKPRATSEVKVLAGKLEEGLNQADKLLEGLLVLARAQRGALGELTEVSLQHLVFAALVADQDEISRLRLTVLDATIAYGVMGNETLLARSGGQCGEQRCPPQRPRRHDPLSRTAFTTGRRTSRLTTGGLSWTRGRCRTWPSHFTAGAERVADNNGAGLGLSIVRAITAHGGTLELHARPEGGLRDCRAADGGAAMRLPPL